MQQQPVRLGIRACRLACRLSHGLISESEARAEPESALSRDTCKDTLASRPPPAVGRPRRRRHRQALQVDPGRSPNTQGDDARGSLGEARLLTRTLTRAWLPGAPQPRHHLQDAVPAAHGSNGGSPQERASRKASP